MTVTPLTRLARVLRSPRLAVALIVALTSYVVVGTLVPRGTADDPAVRAWAIAHPLAESLFGPLGFHHAYASVGFMALILLLVACTATCAVARVRHAVTSWGSITSLSEGALDRLTVRPHAVVPLSSGVEPRVALADAARNLGDLGLRVHDGDRLSDGRAGLVGLLGSPLFHLSIVALMLVAAAGQATRSEGFLGLPLGERIADAHANYLKVDDAPFFGERHTGVSFQASDLIRHHVVNGVDVGAAPVVTAYAGGVEVARGRLFPNSPLRLGSLLVHMVDFGPAITMALEAPTGAEITRRVFLLDRSAETSSGALPTVVQLSGVAAIQVRIQAVARGSGLTTPIASPVSRAVVETSAPGPEQFGPPVVLSEGEFIPLPGGARLRLVDVMDWVRVSVANDWSVVPLYVLFGLAIIGLALAVLVPARRASILLIEDDAGWSLHVATWHSRKDPTFRRRVVNAVREAADAKEGA